MTDNPVLLVSYGDAGGIGPELVARTLENRECTEGVKRLVVGPVALLEEGCKAANMARPDSPVHSNVQDALDDPAAIVLLDHNPTGFCGTEPGQPSAASGAVGLASARLAVDLMSEGQVHGYTYAPMNKASLKAAGSSFDGYPGYLVDYRGKPVISSEVNTIGNLWTTRVTSHIPVSEIASRITREKILEVVRYFDGELRRFGYKNPRIAVSGLNPHNGDGGMFGREEIEVIGPAVEEAKRFQINVDGPFPADTIFLTARDHDYVGVVSMYHDQCQIATKLLGFDEGVTYFGGLPIPLTTPAHGTAYDIAGQGRAELQPMLNALSLARRAMLIAQGRPQYALCGPTPGIILEQFSV